MQYYATPFVPTGCTKTFIFSAGRGKNTFIKKCLFLFCVNKYLRRRAISFFFPRHRLLTSNLQKCWMNPMVLWPAEWKCSQFLSLFFLLRPSVRVCGSGCDTHYNAVCRVYVCVCVFVRISAAQLARTEFSRSLGSVLKNTRATTFLFFRLQFFRVHHHHHHSARAVVLCFSISGGFFF